MKNDSDKRLQHALSDQPKLTLAGVPEGFDALVLGQTAKKSLKRGKTWLHIAADDQRLDRLQKSLAFLYPNIPLHIFPAWDCLPYDRASPKQTIVAERMRTLAALLSEEPAFVITTVNALMQRVPPRTILKAKGFHVAPNTSLDLKALIQFLIEDGFEKVGQVTESGEFAVRGGLIDIFSSTMDQPVRIDLFGDEVETIRTFDPLSQRTTGETGAFTLSPATEFILDESSIARFRKNYHAHFGTVTDDDPLYEAISEGRRFQGMEHWLPLFHEEMPSFFDYIPGAFISMDANTHDAATARHTAIEDYYSARREALSIQTEYQSPYKPLPPELLYLSLEEFDKSLENHRQRLFSPFHESGEDVVEMGGKRGRDFAPERREKPGELYECFKAHIIKSQGQGTVLFAAYSEGSANRMMGVLKDHNIAATMVSNWAKATSAKSAIALVIWPLETGFEAPGLTVITETDLLGERLIRKSKRTRRAENFLTEASSLSPGDLVVHVNHGIGRFEGLEAIEAAGAKHDCLKLTYRGGDRLYLPVENIEMLTRFGADGGDAVLDKLGGTQWQARQARLKKRIREIADDLIKVAATRALKQAPRLEVATGIYEEFSARFSYAETEDQARSIQDVLSDMASGHPMDRLVCGDVGFGKTEVALRGAFVAAMSGVQVALIAPTTLLVRQHFETFAERFRGLPIRIAQLSRLVTSKEASKTRDMLEKGQVDIIIGTHALLAKSIKFRDLGLLIVDEEQHFGVTHKERLKQLRANVHVLTLTATPIPRTLQMAMAGIRDLSLITTPPVDRLAIRTFVMPFDDVVIRDALMREHYRGGQSFFVCPRIADLPETMRHLKELCPELKVVMAHGQMPPKEIDDVMHAFYDGHYDVLLSTTIIESGLDIPRVNTMIVHRADMFGLSQLYQLRGRIGRSKVRAYAYLTVPANRVLTEGATKRLEVLQSLDTLGAGFTVASHDMDIRGAGNLLGEEQSGHVREVGLELYQQMLETAVAEARGGKGKSEAIEEEWSPQINLGVSVLIPESYVDDLNIRMALYRRLGNLESKEDIEGFAAELIDRFGPLPKEVRHLLLVIQIKGFAKRAGIERIEAGGKGLTFVFRGNRFANPAGLVAFISDQGRPAKLRTDHTLVYFARWEKSGARLRGVADIVRRLARIAEEEV